MRWRREVVQAAASHGEDFRIALLTQSEVEPAAVYTEDMLINNIINTVDGVPAKTIPQVRQVGLLALVRNALPTGGESARLIIEGCVYAGGHTVVGGAQCAQALIILDRRWYPFEYMDASRVKPQRTSFKVISLIA